MNLRAAAFPPLLAVLALSACAADKEEYPSLAIRPEERATVTAQPVTPEPEPVPPPLSGPVLSQVTQLRSQAADANDRFRTAAETAQSPVVAARGAAQGSEAWAVAQVALSDVVARHNETVAALAGLDQIKVATQTEGGRLDQIDAAVAEVSALVDSQQHALDVLNGGPEK